MKQKMRRWSASFFALLLCMTLLASTAFAAGGALGADRNGTPYTYVIGYMYKEAEEDEPRGHAVQKTVNALLAVLSVVLFFLTQPLVWRFRLVDWWTVLFVLLCGTALAMLIWKRKEENKAEETDEEETEDFAE